MRQRPISDRIGCRETQRCSRIRCCLHRCISTCESLHACVCRDRCIDRRRRCRDALHSHCRDGLRLVCRWLRLSHGAFRQLEASVRERCRSRRSPLHLRTTRVDRPMVSSIHMTSDLAPGLVTQPLVQQAGPSNADHPWRKFRYTRG